MSTKSRKTKRRPSAYNIFMKKELARLKKINPGLNHKVAFKQAAHGWKGSKSHKIKKTSKNY
jgi:hypothetical protein